MSDTSDISKSQEKSLNNLITHYKDLSEQITIQNNLKNTIGRQIMDFFVLLDIKKLNNVKMVEKVNMKKVSVRQLKKLFNLENGSDNDLINNVMIEVDIDKTIDNLIYINGMAEPVARKVGERLKDLHKTKYIELEIGK